MEMTSDAALVKLHCTTGVGAAPDAALTTICPGLLGDAGVLVTENPLGGNDEMTLEHPELERITLTLKKFCPVTFTVKVTDWTDNTTAGWLELLAGDTFNE